MTSVFCPLCNGVLDPRGTPARFVCKGCQRVFPLADVAWFNRTRARVWSD